MGMVLMMPLLRRAPTLPVLWTLGQLEAAVYPMRESLSTHEREGSKDLTTGLQLREWVIV